MDATTLLNRVKDMRGERNRLYDSDLQIILSEVVAHLEGGNEPPAPKYPPGSLFYRPAGDSDGERIGTDHFVTKADGTEVCIAPDEELGLLFSAAPDLLAALEVLTADMEAEYRDRNGDADHDGIAKARAAIARAMGKN